MSAAPRPLTHYERMLAIYHQQNHAALVAEMQRPRMRAELRRVFDYFTERHLDVAIVGSALRDFDTARDIDVLMPAATDFRQLARELGLKYLGKFPSPLTGGDVRRLSTMWIDGVDKPVQCISDSSVDTFDQWPHQVLLRDGRTLHEGQHHLKDTTVAA